MHRFLLFDWVLIINHACEEYTGMAVKARGEDNCNLTILMDHLNAGEDMREMESPTMDNVVIIHYCFHKCDLNICFEGLQYIQFSMDLGYAMITIIE